MGNVLISLQALSVGFMILWDKECFAVVDWQSHIEELLSTISRLHMAVLEVVLDVVLEVVLEVKPEVVFVVEPERPLVVAVSVALAPDTDKKPDVSSEISDGSEE